MVRSVQSVPYSPVCTERIIQSGLYGPDCTDRSARTGLYETVCKDRSVQSCLCEVVCTEWTVKFVPYRPVCVPMPVFGFFGSWLESVCLVVVIFFFAPPVWCAFFLSSVVRLMDVSVCVCQSGCKNKSGQVFFSIFIFDRKANRFS